MFSTPIEFRRNDIEEYTYRPYGPKEQYSVFNKLKVMRKIRLGNRTWVLTFSKSQEQKTLKTE